MLRYWIFLLVGMVLPGFLAQLPESYTALLILTCLFFVLCFFTHKRTYLYLCAKLCLCLLVGFSWGLYRGHHLLDNQLPIALAGEDSWVSGHITSLVDTNQKRTRFTLTISIAGGRHDFSNPYVSFPKRVQVSWYRSPTWVKALVPGDKLTLKLRLKRPRGFVNPGGFDYQLWQLRRGVGAVGYVRSDTNNVQVESAKKSIYVGS